jgi:hypothetical protein
MAFPSDASQTISNRTITLNKARSFPFSWTDEEKRSMDAGPGFLNIRQDQIAQAIRACVNEMEADIAIAAYKGSSRAFGATAGTAPVITDWAQAKKILDDNGAPMTDRHTVIDTAAGVALRSNSQLQKVNESGDTGLLRQGLLGQLFGFDIRESAQVQTPTSGSMSGASTVSGALTVGQTVLTLKNATGTGTVAAGDIITLANDSNKYVVASASFAGANPATGDTITLAAPGIRKAQSAAERAITVFATSTRNIAFTRNAIMLATRLPENQDGSLRKVLEIVTDPRTGLSFELAALPGDRTVHYTISALWGVMVVKPEHIATIIG